MKRKASSSKRARFRAFAEAFTNAADSTTYLNAYQSALRAGYSSGYARGNAHKLVGKSGIAEEIEAIKNEKRGNPNIASADEVLEVLTMQLRVLPKRLINSETKAIIPLDELSDETSQCIAGYEVIDRTIPGGNEDGGPTHERKTKYKLVDRQKAADMLGRWHGIWEKDNRQKADPAPQALVAFPVGPMSLESWQEQAVAIIKAQKEAEASRP